MTLPSIYQKHRERLQAMGATPTKDAATLRLLAAVRKAGAGKVVSKGEWIVIKKEVWQEVLNAAREVK